VQNDVKKRLLWLKEAVGLFFFWLEVDLAFSYLEPGAPLGGELYPRR